MSRTSRFVAVLGVALLAAIPLSAQEPAPTGEVLLVHPEAREAIGGLKSPWCPGRMLETCPSPDAALLRDSIQKLATAGVTADSIVESVLREYGPEWRAAPLATGTGLWAWLLPPMALLAGLATVATVVARRRRVRPVLSASLLPGGEARLEEALRELEETERPAF